VRGLRNSTVPGLHVLLAVLCMLWVGIPTGSAGEPDLPELVVGTSGDYAPFSVEDPDEPGEFSGFDVELARRFAEARGYQLRFVRFRWPDLLGKLRAEHFDVVMSGVTIRPERAIAGSFTPPVIETGAVALVRADSWTELDALDRPQIRIAVNAGGHLERVAAARFPRATRVSIADNASVLAALRERVVEAVVTDSAEAPRWQEQLPGLVVLGPFTRDRKAPLVRADRTDLAAQLGEWLLEAEQDGTLEALRQEHVGPGPWRATAEPLTALLAALDERLSVMPRVGFVKRSTGIPLEVPEREEIVLDAAWQGVLAAAKRRELPPPAEATVRRFFRAQLEAAKQVQRDAVADRSYEPAPPQPDLDADLRPALLRIGERIAALLLALPPGLDATAVRSEAGELLREPRLAEQSRRQLVEATLALLPEAQPREKARASSPAATGSTIQTP